MKIMMKMKMKMMMKEEDEDDSEDPMNQMTKKIVKEIKFHLRVK
jgi:hypothetical protein